MLGSASLILLKDPPAPDPEVHAVDLGQISDGIFLADRFPTVARLGALLRLEFGEGHHGVYDLRLFLSQPVLPEDDEEWLSDDLFDLIEGRTLNVVQPDPSWTTPRVVFVPIELTLEFSSEADVALWVSVDDELVADHPMLVRTPPALPRAIGPSADG